MKSKKNLIRKLDELYKYYDNRKFVHPDPLEFLYGYPDIYDREIVALIASSLAYGRVIQILKSVSTILNKMDPSPRSFLIDSSEDKITRTFKEFKHRFTTGDEMAAMLIGAKHIVKEEKSLYESFLSQFNDNDDTVLTALTGFVRRFNRKTEFTRNSLLPSPDLGSACKRLNLFLRWMVRTDRVDPGGWEKVPASKLIIPLDTHMHRIGIRLGMTDRKQADMRAAIEITDAFRALSPDDPVKYDFSLTRLGIRKDADLDQFLENI